MAIIKKWTEEELLLLKRYYPTQGKLWCANALGRTESSVRWKAHEIGLKQDKDGAFFKDWQIRAAQSKVGKKRPDQALVIKEMHEQGKFVFTDDRKKAMSERSKKWIAENGHPKGMLGKPQTEKAKIAVSLASIARWGSMTEDDIFNRTKKSMETRERNGTLPPERIGVTWKGGWREIGGYKKYYRSRWEANYARYLEWMRLQGLIAGWLHEPKTFWFEGIKRGAVSYLPDFCVKDNQGNETYHEVKGWMDNRSKTKIRRMAKYHPKVTLIVVDSKAYKYLERNFQSIVPEWEKKDA